MGLRELQIIIWRVNFYAEENRTQRGRERRGEYLHKILDAFLQNDFTKSSLRPLPLCVGQKYNNLSASKPKIKYKICKQ